MDGWTDGDFVCVWEEEKRDESMPKEINDRMITASTLSAFYLYIPLSCHGLAWLEEDKRARERPACFAYPSNFQTQEFSPSLPNHHHHHHHHNDKFHLRWIPVPRLEEKKHIYRISSLMMRFSRKFSLLDADRTALDSQLYEIYKMLRVFFSLSKNLLKV